MNKVDKIIIGLVVFLILYMSIGMLVVKTPNISIVSSVSNSSQTTGFLAPIFFPSSNNQTNDSKTILLLGTDERSTETSRTDTIIVAKYNSKTKKALLISIPRDTRVNISQRGLDKINAAHAYGGVELTKKTIENLLNTTIDNYAKVNFYGFMDITNSIGGVKVNAKNDIVWKDEDLKKDFHIVKGEQTLKGDDLLIYVRFRKDSQGDYGRMQRQQEVMVSLVKEFLNPKNIFKLPEVINIAQKYIKTDLNWNDILQLGFSVRNIDNIQIETYTLKTTSEKINGIWYEVINEKSLIELQDKLKE